MLESLDKIGTDIIGGAVLTLFGWLGWKKAKKVAVSDTAETDVITLLQKQVNTLSQKYDELYIAYTELQRQVLAERSECGRKINELENKLASMVAKQVD